MQQPHRGEMKDAVNVPKGLFKNVTMEDFPAQREDIHTGVRQRIDKIVPAAAGKIVEYPNLGHIFGQQGIDGM